MDVFLLILASSMVGDSYAEYVMPRFQELQQMNGYRRDPSQDLETSVFETRRNVEVPKQKYDMEKIQESISGFFDDLDPTPSFRAKRKQIIRPEVVSLNSGHKAVKVELTADTLMETLKTLLASPKVRTYADVLARKAAVFYRSVQDEMTKDKHRGTV